MSLHRCLSVFVYELFWCVRSLVVIKKNRDSPSVKERMKYISIWIPVHNSFLFSSFPSPPPPPLTLLFLLLSCRSHHSFYWWMTSLLTYSALSVWMPTVDTYALLPLFLSFSLWSVLREFQERERERERNSEVSGVLALPLLCREVYFLAFSVMMYLGMLLALSFSFLLWTFTPSLSPLLCLNL